MVVQQAKLAKQAGLDGIVCSGLEVKLVKKICKKMEVITPGVRLPGDTHQGSRVDCQSTDGIGDNQATAIVIGRSTNCIE